MQIGPGKGDGVSGTDDLGWQRVTGLLEHRYTFRTPSLLNVERTGPYGHAGQFATLDAIVRHYDDADDQLEDYNVRAHVRETQLHNMVEDNRDEIAAGISPIVDDLDEVDVQGIVAFFRALTDPSIDDLSGLVPDSVPSGLPVVD